MVLHQRGGFSSQLLIAGGSGWKNSNIYATADKLGLSKDAVKFLGYVPEEDLPLLYSGARLFVFPSVYEGFGLPLIEAMACGAPVVASRTPALVEVSGVAAMLIDPLDEQALALALETLLEQGDSLAYLHRAGLEQAARYPWTVAAN